MTELEVLKKPLKVIVSDVSDAHHYFELEEFETNQRKYTGLIAGYVYQKYWVDYGNYERPSEGGKLGASELHIEEMDLYDENEQPISKENELLVYEIIKKSYYLE